MAAASCVANARYTYIHDDNKGPLEAVDAHHVVVRKSSAKSFLVYLSAPIFITTAFSLFLLKDESILILLWSLFLSAFLVKLFLRKPVEKGIAKAEGFLFVVFIPCSGRIIHRFIPIDKILKPVLNECVTPVTCYWSLSLIIREEEELLLVFKELHPPVKMLIPIWKALCATTDNPVTQVPIR